VLRNQNPFTAPLREARRTALRAVETAADRGLPMPASSGATPIGANDPGTGAFTLFGLLDLSLLDGTFYLQ
jgi:hypothetical protein